MVLLKTLKSSGLKLKIHNFSKFQSWIHQKKKHVHNLLTSMIDNRLICNCSYFRILWYSNLIIVFISNLQARCWCHQYDYYSFTIWDNIVQGWCLFFHDFTLWRLQVPSLFKIIQRPSKKSTNRLYFLWIKDS